jgi:hypothetical protein
MNIEPFAYPEGKTNYQINDEDGNKTTITIEKWVADILQFELPNVHKSIQSAYDKSLKEKPDLKRKQRGNYLREMSIKTAEQFQETKKKIVGWNNIDLLESFK